MRTGTAPYLGQVYISDQYQFFIYIGRGQYMNQLNRSIQDGKDLTLAILPGDFKIYDREIND